MQLLDVCCGRFDISLCSFESWLSVCSVLGAVQGAEGEHRCAPALGLGTGGAGVIVSLGRS